MNATVTASPVPATAEGIACANCSGWVNGRKVQVRHADRTAVRACSKLVADRKASAAPTVDRAAQAIADAQAHMARHPELTTVRITELPPVPARTVPVGGSWAGTSEPVAPTTLAEVFASDHQGLLDPSPADMLTQAEASAERTVANVTAPDPEKVVPAGRYAIMGPDGEPRFYHIDKPTEGKWAGWTFVNQRVTDNLYPVKNRAKKVGILAAISLDVEGARLLFAQEIGMCMRCGRTLTSKWRKVGMGEECASK